MSADEVLYEKCDGCHFFVAPNESLCSSTGDGCTCGWRCDLDGEAYTAAYLAHVPLNYEHLDRGDEHDALMQCSEARPSGRKANLLAWKTYGPIAMRERFTS